MHSSPYSTKPQHATEPHSPLAKATKQLLHSLDALLTVATALSKGRFPSKIYIADVADGSTHSLTSDSRRIATHLCNLLQSLLACIQKLQRTASSRIDEEIDASYSLEMNYSVSSFRETLLSAPHDTMGNTTDRCIQDFSEIIMVWTKHYQVPRFQRWKDWKEKVSSLARRGSSRTRQISLLESKFISERKPIPISPSYPGSMISPIYALDDYLEWSTPMSPFDRTATAIGPCRAVYLYQRKNTLSRHEYLVFGFGVETPTNWCRVDRIASPGRGCGALTESSPELICFAMSKLVLVSPESEELGAIIVDLPKDRSGLIFIGECNRYMRQSVLDFPETTLFSANITYFARCTMISLVIIFTRLEKRHANDRTTILCWGNLWNTRLSLVLQACRTESRPKFFLDYHSKILAKGEALLHRSFLRDYHEQDEYNMIRVLNKSVMMLYHVTVHGPEHLRLSANALMTRGYATVAYRHYLLSEWEDACEFGRRCLHSVPWAREPPDASMPFDALEREAFGGVLIGSHVAALAFIRLKNFEQALLTAQNAEPLARCMSNDGSPSSRWTLVYGALRGSVARGLMKDPREGAKEEGIAISREAEDIMRKMHKVHPAISTATRLVLQIINLGTVLFESKELVSAFDQAEAAMQILRQNKLRDPHHLAVVTWALSCHGRWSTAVGRMAEAVNGNQETMVHIWWVPTKHRQRLTQIHVPVLDTLLLRRRTYDILENFGDPWPLGDYYKTTDNARDCFKVSPVHNGFLLGDCLTSQAWAVFNKDPDHPEKAVKLELEALQRFDWYKDYQHPRAHFQAIRSLCMLTLYHACAGDPGEAVDACEDALDRTRRANYALRRAILVEAAGWADEHGLRLIKEGRVEDGARLKGAAWKLRTLLLEICVANGEDDSVFSGGFRPPTRGVQDDRNNVPDIAEVTPLPPSPVPSNEDSQITPTGDENTVSEGSSTPTAAARSQASFSSVASATC